MPSLHTVGAAEGCSFRMHFHLGTNPHQRLPEIIVEPFFFHGRGEFVNLILHPEVRRATVLDYIDYNVCTIFIWKSSLIDNRFNKLVH